MEITGEQQESVSSSTVISTRPEMWWTQNLLTILELSGIKFNVCSLPNSFNCIRDCFHHQGAETVYSQLQLMVLKGNTHTGTTLTLRMAPVTTHSKLVRKAAWTSLDYFFCLYGALAGVSNDPPWSPTPLSYCCYAWQLSNLVHVQFTMITVADLPSKFKVIF